MGLLGAMVLFTSFMSVLGIVQNKRIRRFPNSGDQIPELYRIKSNYEIILSQIDFVVTIITNQGDVHVTLSSHYT